MMRMAGQFLKSLVPKTTGEAVMRFAPDVAFAGMAAAMAPESASGLERIGIAGEDLGISLLGSIAGSGVGRGLGRATLGKKLANAAEGTEDAVKRANHLDRATNFGDMIGQGATSFISPRPVFEGVLEKEAISQAEKQQQLQELREAELVEAAINAAALSGYGVNTRLGLGAPVYQG